MANIDLIEAAEATERVRAFLAAYMSTVPEQSRRIAFTPAESTHDGTRLTVADLYTVTAAAAAALEEVRAQVAAEIEALVQPSMRVDTIRALNRAARIARGDS